MSASKYGNNPVEWVHCVWFDAETGLPVHVEERGQPADGMPSGWTKTIIGVSSGQKFFMYYLKSSLKVLSLSRIIYWAVLSNARVSRSG
jgi:hypothetical protein